MVLGVFAIDVKTDIGAVNSLNLWRLWCRRMNCMWQYFIIHTVVVSQNKLNLLTSEFIVNLLEMTFTNSPNTLCSIEMMSAHNLRQFNLVPILMQFQCLNAQTKTSAASVLSVFAAYIRTVGLYFTSWLTTFKNGIHHSFANLFKSDLWPNNFLPSNLGDIHTSCNTIRFDVQQFSVIVQR